MKSIMQDRKECYITGRTDNLHKHHIFYGSGLRKISEQNGFHVWLTYDLHNGNNPEAVHNNPNTGYDLMLKVKCQEIFEQTHSRADFMRIIGRNYRED